MKLETTTSRVDDNETIYSHDTNAENTTSNLELNDDDTYMIVDDSNEKFVANHENENVDTKNNSNNNNNKKIDPKESGTLMTSSRERESKTLFKLSSHSNKTLRDRLEECILLYETLYEENGYNSRTNSNIDLFTFKNISKENLSLCLFVNRMSTLKLIDMELAEMKEHSSSSTTSTSSSLSDKSYVFDIWKGNFSKAINNLAKKSQLNDFHLSLYQLALNGNLDDNVKELVDGYVNECLMKNLLLNNNNNNNNNKSNNKSQTTLDNLNKAVLYALACYDVPKAIDIYMKAKHFQYALCLANLRLRGDNQLIVDILNKYADYSLANGDYETAILCNLRLNKIDNCLKLLMRRDPSKIIGGETKNNTTTTTKDDKKIFDILFEKFQKELLARN